MPCLLAILVLAFPRIAIVLLWFFTRFFTGVYDSIVIPLLGFIFLPLTLIVYTYLRNSHQPMGTTQLVMIFIAVLLDLGLAGGGTFRRRSVD